MSTTATASIGERIQAFRRRIGMTQAELAAETGISIDSIQNWECGRRHLTSMDALVALCKSLEVTADELLGIEREAK